MGQDLAYTKDKTHVEGSYKKEDTSHLLKSTFPVEGNYEEKVETSGDLLLFIDWYKTFIDGARKRRPDLRVINATEGGAKIEGTEVMTLKEAIREVCTKEYNVQEFIDNIPPAFNEEQRKTVVKYLQGTSQGFEDIKNEADKCKKVYKKIDNMTNTGNISPKEYLKLLNQVKKCTKRINKRWELYQLIDMSLVNAKMIMQKENLLDEESVLEEAKEISRKGMLYMDLLSQCAELFAEASADLYQD